MTEYRIRTVACAYFPPPSMLEAYLLNFCQQTAFEQTRLTIYHDGPGLLSNPNYVRTLSTAAHYFKPGQIEFLETKERLHNEEARDGWGHYQKDLAINTTEEEFIKFDNVDNYMTPICLEVAMKAMDDYKLDFLYWDLLHNYPNVNGDGQGAYNVLKSSPTLNRIDVSNFLVKTEKAKQVGWKHYGTGGDGFFVMDLMKIPNIAVGKLPAVLNCHN